MSTVFVGGSRMAPCLPKEAEERLANIVRSGFKVIVGDANGADKTIQHYLLNTKYSNVEVFCSGNRCRNNLGKWPTRNIQAPKSAKGFQFYAIKDREMASEADFGLMLWDGKSPGTILNVLRLVKAGKMVVLIDVNAEKTLTFKSAADWKTFFVNLDQKLKNDLRKRATPTEWEFSEQRAQASLFEPTDNSSSPTAQEHEKTQSDKELISGLNAALSSGSMKSVLDSLGHLARTRRGMSQIAKETGLSRESLYRALSSEGNPKYTTVLKVIDAVGLRFRVEETKNQSNSPAE